jgi:hypothetical protein
MRQVDGHQRTFAMRSDGKGLVRASEASGCCDNPDLSSDGTMVAGQPCMVFVLSVALSKGIGRLHQNC